jgi:hypothetical protein
MFDKETDYDIYTDDNFSEAEEFHDAEGSDAEETDDDYQETQDEWNMTAEGADILPSPLPEFHSVP